jgi:hypothetical protein
MKKIFTPALATIALYACASLITTPVLADPKPPAEKSASNGINQTADWHQDPECQVVFFTVLEGLYRDGISQEVVDIIIGHVEANKIDKSFVFRCKLCHACYEAFALYQRRPDFNGTEGRNTIGHKEIPEQLIDDLRSGDIQKFNTAFAEVVQPWIRAELKERLANGEDGLELMKKYVKLAEEGDKLRRTYLRCQACDAISEIAKVMGEKKLKKIVPPASGTR